MTRINLGRLLKLKDEPPGIIILGYLIHETLLMHLQTLSMAYFLNHTNTNNNNTFNYCKIK